MKGLIITAVALSAGLAGMAEGAPAGPGEARKRAAARRLMGGIRKPARRFYVKYHIDGTKRMRFQSHSAALRMQSYLRSLGANVKLGRMGRQYDLTYHMRGTAVRRFYSQTAARAFERRIERLGFQARVLL